MNRANDHHTLTPTLVLLLDPEVYALGPALALALARRSAAAAELATTADLAARPATERDALFRAAVERVTDLRARSAALREGFEIRDELFVLLAFTLGGEHPAGAELKEVLEMVARLARDFYAGTRFEVHALALLPDLRVEREAAYARAYEQLAMLDAAVGPTAPRLASGEPLLARRWLADCRSESGAHAGGVREVAAPLAEFFGALCVGTAAGEQDRSFEMLLRGAALERLTGYSAPGYTEIVFEPHVLARHFACRLGAEVLSEAIAPALACSDAPKLETAAAECLTAVALSTVADQLHPRHGEGTPDDIQAHRRRRTRERLREEAGSVARGRLGAVLDDSGIPAARLVSGLLRGPIFDSPFAKELRAQLSLDVADRAARQRIGEVLEIDRLRELAETLDREAGELEATDEADREILLEGQRKRRDAGELRERAGRYSRLLEPGADLDALETELLRLLDTRAPEALAVAVPPQAAPPASAAPKQGRVGRILSALGLRAHPGAPAPDPESAPPASAAPVPPPATSEPTTYGPADDRLLAEWLRWIAEFRGDLARVSAELGRFEREAEESAHFYERQAAWLLDRLTEDERFNHRLLSKRQCEDLYAARRAPLLAHLGTGSALPLSRFFDRDVEMLETLQHPLNHRFEGLDPELDQAAAAVFADWIERDVESLLLEDPEVCARAAPANRLRALADAARPLVRPEHGALRPAAGDLLLLPRSAGASRIPALAPAAAGSKADLADGHDPRRVAIRSVLHGFPAFSLAQLRPVRERAVGAGVRYAGESDPLPEAVLVDERHHDVLALGLAFGRIVREDGRIRLPGLELVADYAALAHHFTSTFAGSGAYARLRTELAADLAAPDGPGRLRTAAEEVGRDETHRQMLRRMLEELEKKRWPEALPLPEEG